MLHIGCSGFPVARAAYFASLDAVEASPKAGRFPGTGTLERWRQEAPRDFAFSVVASEVIGRGEFRPSHALDEAWERTRAAAQALDARFVVFETPSAFYPQADHLRDMYAFFKSVPREGRSFAWQPAGSWESGLLRRVCADLKLVHAVDPLAAASVTEGVRYFRLRGGGRDRRPSRGYRYAEAELRELSGLAAGKTAYAFFQTAEMWPAARALKELEDRSRGLVARSRGNR